MANPKANRPQAQFLRLPHKYRGFVAGFGCVREDTLVQTERGNVPICEIRHGERILSYSYALDRFQLSPSIGGFLKGKANLYRVTTKRGRFVSTGHHRVCVGRGRYRFVRDLCVGESVFSSSQTLDPTSSDIDLLELPSSDLHCTQTDADYQGSYGDGFRHDGQRPQMSVNTGLSSSPSLACVQLSFQSGDPCGQSQMDVQPEHSHRHSHHEQSSDRIYRNRSALHSQSLDPFAEDHASASTLERISQSSQLQPQSLSMSGRHQIANGSDQCCIDFSQSKACAETVVEAIEKIGEDWYWDTSVAYNHNYVLADGSIHHNTGKTWVGGMSHNMHFMNHPKINAGYFAPTYGQIRDIYYPTIDEVAYSFDNRVEIKQGNKEIHFYRGPWYLGTVICRTMDNPANIVGFKIGHAVCDEMDLLTIEKADLAFKKIQARMRYKVDGVKNGIDIITTPEGFKWTYQQFEKLLIEKPDRRKNYAMVQASTYENEVNLPDDYIPSLLENYPTELVEAYLLGKFTNLRSGTIYSAYDREKHRSKEFIQPGDDLKIGMDFNVNKMAAVVYVIRKGVWHAVDELKDIRDTPAMIATLENRYKPQDVGGVKLKHRITVYPDSSGKSTKSTDASTSDIALLSEAKLNPLFRPSNPFVKDRINAANGAFSHGRLMVNDTLCPTYSSTLEQQVYDKNGEPDKKSGFDHQNDAGTYPIAYEMPIRKPMFDLNIGFAV